MKIVIDARLYGPKHTGPGRYVEKLVQNLVKVDHTNHYHILLRKEYYDTLKFPSNWTKIMTDFRHYSVVEQLKLPFLLYKLSPDLVHFPHFNVPVFYFGKYVVTIHDLIMHKFKGGTATTRKFPRYQIWRLGYHLSFAKAVYGSIRVIVPSNTIKKEVVSFYKISSKKVEVTYEG